MKTFNILPKARWLVTITLLLSLCIPNVWGITVSDISTSAATTLTDGGQYVVATAYNGTYLTTSVSSGWGGSTTSAGSAAIYTVHGSKSGFYLTCSAGTLVPATSKTFSAYNSGTSNNLSISASGEIQNLSNTSWKLRLNGASGFRWYSSSTGSAVYLFAISTSSPSLSATPTSLDWTTVNKGASLNTKTFSISGSNLTSGSLTISASGGYSVSPTSVSVNGTLAATTITVTPPSTSTAGTKNGTITISGGGLASNVTVSCGLVVNEIDQFIDEVQSTSGYTSASPHVEAGSYGTTPTLSDKTVATSGTCEQQHYHFVGWITSDKYTAGTAIADGDLQTPTSATGETYYAVWAKQAAGGGGDVSDIINNAATTDALGSTGTSTWASDFTVTGSNSSAVYTIHSMGINGATNYALQWNKNAYLYTSTAPTSGLKLKSITITTLADKSIALYGATSAYAAKADATSLVSQSFGTSGTTYSLTAAQLSSNYTCVGINGTTSSTQIVSITITYSGGVSYEDYIAKCCTPLGTINGSFLLT